MNTVIFLDKIQKRILAEAGLHICNITDEQLRNNIVSNDYRKIQERTKELMKTDQLLDVLGLTGNPISGLNLCIFKSKLPNAIDKFFKSSNVLDFVYIDDNTIVVYELDDDTRVDLAYDMLVYTIINLAKAFYKRFTYTQLIKTCFFYNVIATIP